MFTGSPAAAMLRKVGKGTCNAGCPLPKKARHARTSGGGQEEGCWHSATSWYQDRAQQSPLYDHPTPRWELFFPPLPPNTLLGALSCNLSTKLAG